MIYGSYSNFFVEEILNDLIVERADYQFHVKAEKVLETILLYVKDSNSDLNKLSQQKSLLMEKRESLIANIQQTIDNESLEVNGVIKNRFVVDFELKFIGINKDCPVLSFYIESERHELIPSETNRIILRRQECKMPYEETLSWTFPGLISDVLRVNQLRPPSDIPTKIICGSRVDLDNGETFVSGGHDIFEFQYLEDWGKFPEVSLKKKKRSRLF